MRREVVSTVAHVVGWLDYRLGGDEGAPTRAACLTYYTATPEPIRRPRRPRPPE